MHINMGNLQISKKSRPMVEHGGNTLGVNIAMVLNNCTCQ